MASLRCLRPSLRLSTRLHTHRSLPSTLTARHLHVETAPVLFSASSKVTGAHEGEITGDDLTFGVTTPGPLGGPGTPGRTNPGELLAAGYSACFQSAMKTAAHQLGVRMPKGKQDSVVETTVHLVGDAKTADLGTRVDMSIRIRGLEEDVIDKVVAGAKKICPYSRAMEGNVVTKITTGKLD